MLEQLKQKTRSPLRAAILGIILLAGCEGKNPVSPDDVVEMIIPQLKTTVSATATTEKTPETPPTADHDLPLKVIGWSGALLIVAAMTKHIWDETIKNTTSKN